LTKVPVFFNRFLAFFFFFFFFYDKEEGSPSQLIWIDKGGCFVDGVDAIFIPSSINISEA
jgi:hypothetical protein